MLTYCKVPLTVYQYGSAGDWRLSFIVGESDGSSNTAGFSVLSAAPQQQSEAVRGEDWCNSPSTFPQTLPSGAVCRKRNNGLICGRDLIGARRCRGLLYDEGAAISHP